MSLNYRKEIDGLRALAVIPVIFFHGDFEIFKRGFLGVDIFFVISGYLITTLIIKDLINKNFSILIFFERRARRILPALYFVMIATIPFSWVLLSRNELGSYIKSLAATSIFLSNFFFWTEIPYFASESDLKPLLHTWSLAIEEQFYIFFPLLLIFIWKFNKKLIIYFLLLILILSLLLCFFSLAKAPNANFYFTFTRIWELCVGGIVAYLIIKNRFNFSELFNNILSLFGLIIIIYSIFFYNFDSTSIPQAFLPIIGSVFIIIFANKNTVVGKFLSLKVFTGVGIISYSLYLWHYPIFAFAKNSYHEIDLKLKFLIIFFSFIISVFSYKFIEKPFRNNNFITLKNFTKSIIWCTLFFILFSVFTFKYFTNKGRDEAKLAELLVDKGAIFFQSMDERIFTKERIIYENDNPQVLVVGSSRIMQLGENELKKNTLNLSVSGASIEDNIAIIEMALEKFNPEIIYLGADPWLFNVNNNQNRWKSLKSEYYRSISNIDLWNQKKEDFNKKKLIDEEDKIIHLNLIENLLEKLYIKINLNSNFALPGNDLNISYKQIILRDGKRIYDLKYQNQKKKAEIVNYSMNNYEFSIDKFYYYNNYLDYLINYHKKEIILVLAPYYYPSFELTVKEIPAYLEIEKNFTNLASKHKIKIIGSYNPKFANCGIEEFYDSMHPKDTCMQKLIK
jgi:peptidoglycan/LPS O-acetylase OafA/YrhL